MDIELFITQNKEAFLKGKLSKENNALFLDRLKKGDEFAKNLTMEKEIVDAIKYQENILLREQLDKIHKKVIPAHSIGGKRMFLNLLAAAIFIGVLVTTGIFMNNNMGSSHQDLANSYFEPYDFTVVQRSAIGEDEKQFLLFEKYQKKNYAECIPLFNELLSSNPEDNDLKLGLGISHFKLDETASAHQQFDEIINDRDPFLQDKAKWYKALTFLKESKIVEAKKLLVILKQNPSNDHYKDAKTLLEELK